jgi:hypothetical protein
MASFIYVGQQQFYSILQKCYQVYGETTKCYTDRNWDMFKQFTYITQEMKLLNENNQLFNCYLSEIESTVSSADKNIVTITNN